MSAVDRVDRFQRRHPSSGFPLAVLYKYIDDQGNYLAALITYYGVVSLFPLLLLLNTILRFALHGNPAAQQSVIESALGRFPLVSSQLTDPNGISGSVTAVVIGVVGTLYGALGVGQAVQNAMNITWLVPRASRGNPIRQRARGLLLLCVLAISVLGTSVLTAIGVSGPSFGARIDAGITVLLVLASVLINAVVFTLAFKVATARPVTVAQVAPGAVLAAVGWQLLQSVGATYIGHVVRNASAVNGVFALILGLIAWIYLEAVIVLFANELNVVRALRLYPRSLLTPFTDSAELTQADRAMYAGAAIAQRMKSFEEIEVTFTPESDDRAGESE